MKININKNVYNNGYLANKYSKYAEDKFRIDDIPYVNFPFEVQNIKDDYKFISWVLLDHDSNPLVQFSWIHWLVSNYKVEKENTKIPELLLKSGKVYAKGINSFAGPLTNVNNKDIVYNYGGPTPPDKDHVYTLEVYAHDNELNLKDGYYYNEFVEQLEKVDYEKGIIKILAKK